MALNDHPNADLATLIGREVAKATDPFIELMKSLEGPAKAQGLTPQQLLGSMTDGGRNAGIVGPGGQWMPAPAAQYGAQKKTCGWGGLLRDLAITTNPNAVKASHEERTASAARLNKSAAEGGWGVTKAALAENSGVTGGYTVPPQFSENLLRIATEDAIVGPRASKIPMTSMAVSVPSLDHTGTGAGSTRFLGGIQAKWTVEAATRDETEPLFKQTELKAHELSFYTLASNNLLADNAVGLDTLLTTLFGAAIEWYTEYAYLREDGVGKPQGILDSAPTIAVTRGTSSRVRWVDLVTMKSRLLAQSWSRAIWVAHPSVFVDLMLMHDSQGNQTGFGAGRPVFISSDGGMQKREPDTLLGTPIYWTEKLPLLGVKGDIMLIDPFYYLLGQRAELEIAVSAHSAFLTNQMTWRVVFRGDGRPWLHSAITLADNTHTVSPFVCIAT